MRANVKERSRKAVAAAGSRQRQAPVDSAGTWREERGKRAQGPFRPGKTARKRQGRRAS